MPAGGPSPKLFTILVPLRRYPFARKREEVKNGWISYTSTSLARSSSSLVLIVICSGGAPCRLNWWYRYFSLAICPRRKESSSSWSADARRYLRKPFGKKKTSARTRIARSRKREKAHAFELFPYRKLLGADETRDGYLDSSVDVVSPHVLAQVHLGACFGHSDRTF
jgi:hypothetical protein